MTPPRTDRDRLVEHLRQARILATQLCGLHAEITESIRAVLDDARAMDETEETP